MKTFDGAQARTASFELRRPLMSRRLLLRPLIAADAASLLAYRSLPSVCQYVPFEPMDRPTVLERIQGDWARRELDAEGQTLILGIELLDARELVGDVMLRWLSVKHGCGEIGYVLNPRFSGNGYATEAAHRCLHVAFDDFGLHRVVAHIVSQNITSNRLVERLGMRQEAHLVQSEWFKGHWVDMFHYGMHQQEWQAQHQEGCPWRERSKSSA
jgi:RimJ/RimL family protein N-acetyltransferase